MSLWQSITNALVELEKDLTNAWKMNRQNAATQHEHALEMWISELIQNAIDARWSKSQELEIEFDFFDDKNGDFCFEFSHNGRPPQSFDLSTNELRLMLQLGGTKTIDFASVGEFGIGFKIWMLFQSIEIEHGHGRVECQINNPIRTSWVQEKKGRFFVRAKGAKKELLPGLAGGNNPSEERLLAWFKRAFDGLRQRNEPCTIRVKKGRKNWISFRKKSCPVGEGFLAIAEEVIPRLDVEAWVITGDGMNDLFDKEQRVISFSASKLGQVQLGDLHGVIASAFSVRSLKNGLKAIYDGLPDSEKPETLQAFLGIKAKEAAKSVTVSLNLSDTPFKASELEYSLFSIKPKLRSQGSRMNRFFAFQGNYKVDRSRQYFDDMSHRRYNGILRGIAMNVFLDVLKLLNSHPNLLEEAGLSMDAYQSMLDAFGRGSSEEDPSIKHWTESVNLDTMHQLLGPEGTACWPTSHNKPLTYSQLSFPRPRLVEFLNHDDPTISEWAKETLRDDEAVYLHEGEGDGTWIEYTWSLGEDHPYTLHTKQHTGDNPDLGDSPEKRPVQPLPAALRKQLQDELLKEEEE